MASDQAGKTVDAVEDLIAKCDGFVVTADQHGECPRLSRHN